MIAFEPLRREHMPLMRDWLGREHVRRWWRDDIDESIAEYEREIGGGGDPTENYLIFLDGRPVGFIQTYLVSDYPEWDEIVEVGEGVAGVDLFVGEEDLTGRGLGSKILDRFVSEVVFGLPETTAVVATVEDANRRSWRAFEKAGFRHVRDVDEDGLPHRLMRLERRYAQ